jgi:hypothetical protein
VHPRSEVVRFGRIAGVGGASKASSHDDAPCQLVQFTRTSAPRAHIHTACSTSWSLTWNDSSEQARRRFLLLLRLHEVKARSAALSLLLGGGGVLRKTRFGRSVVSLRSSNLLQRSTSTPAWSSWVGGLAGDFRAKRSRLGCCAGAQLVSRSTERSGQIAGYLNAWRLGCCGVTSGEGARGGIIMMGVYWRGCWSRAEKEHPVTLGDVLTENIRIPGSRHCVT